MLRLWPPGTDPSRCGHEPASRPLPLTDADLLELYAPETAVTPGARSSGASAGSGPAPAVTPGARSSGASAGSGPAPAVTPGARSSGASAGSGPAPARLRVNFVSSLDGAVTLDGFSEGLSGPADKRVFGILRMVCDALIVGAGTVRDEGYRGLRLSPERRSWRIDHGLPEYPTLVVVSHRLALDPAHPALADAPVRPFILTGGASPPAARRALNAVADVLVHGAEELDLAAGLADLHARGLRQLLCEGGPRLFGALTAADLVDELCLTVSPLLAGAGAGRIAAGPPAPEPRRMALRHALVDGDFFLLRYVRPLADHPSPTP
jgi:riboflavin biosynthesis pyrimidine reductase